MVNQGTSGGYTEDDIGYYGTVTSKCSRCGYSTSEKQLIRKWADFDTAYMRQALINYACNKYGCKYDSSMTTSNSGYYPNNSAFGYSEDAILNRDGYAEVDLTFQYRMQSDGETLEDLFASPYRVNVIVQQRGRVFDITVLYG